MMQTKPLCVKYDKCKVNKLNLRMLYILRTISCMHYGYCTISREERGKRKGDRKLGSWGGWR